MKELDIQEFDTYKYLSWLYEQEALNKDEFIKELERRRAEDFELIEKEGDYTIEEIVELKEKTNLSYKQRIEEAEKCTYWKPPTENDKNHIEYLINTQFQIKKDCLDNLLERVPISRISILKDEIDKILSTELQEYDDLVNNILLGCVVSDYGRLGFLIGLVRFAQYLENEISKEKYIQDAEEKKAIKWLGKVSHLGYIIGLLAENGYIEAPKRKNGETNYNEFARQICNVIDFEGNNIGTLSKMLNIEANNMEYKNKDAFQIPHIKDIS